MTSRSPVPLRSRLRAAHPRVRRAPIARHALRATAAALVLLAFCVTAGLALPRDPSTAVLRLGVFVLGTCVALAMAMRALWRDFPRWDAWLESLEGRFTDLRSWLRNALDMEQEERESGGSGPAPHTSGELADAVQERAARRLDGTPLGETVPPPAARNAVPRIAVATPSLVASAV